MESNDLQQQTFVLLARPVNLLQKAWEQMSKSCSDNIIGFVGEETIIEICYSI